MKAIGIAGWSGSGKTMLVSGIVNALTAAGVSVSTIKHAHRRFDMDREGKDSHRHRTAGAGQVLVISPERSALLTEHRGAAEPSLQDALKMLNPVDLVVIEGYRGAGIPKIEIWRSGRGGDPLWPDDPNIIAVASDVAEDALPAPLGALPLLDLDDHAAAAAFVQRQMALLIES